MPSFPSRELRAGAELLAATWASLFVLDVLTNLGLVQRAASSQPQLVAYFQDYVGLLLAEAQVAISLVGVAYLAAVALSWLRRNGDHHLESRALVAGQVAALSTVDTAGPRSMILMGLTAWGVVRLVLSGDRGNRNRPLELMAQVLVPSLLIGYTRYGLGFVGVSGRLATVLTAMALGLVAWAAVATSGQSRRRWAYGLALGAVAVALLLVAQSVTPPSQASGPVASTSPSSTPRPSIVLVVLDTLRADHLREYGYSRNTMPALGRWSENALTVARAVSAAGWTVPAHASIFSGRTVSDHGVHNSAVKVNSGVFWTEAEGGVRWLPQTLTERGYRSVAVVANPLAITRDVFGFTEIIAPTRPYWESTIGALGDRLVGFTNRLSERLRWRMPYVDAERITDIAMAAIPDEEGPVFLFVNYMDAHSPYNPPQESLELLGIDEGHLFDRYHDHQLLTRTWADLPQGKQRYLIDLYDGELRGLDAQVERLLAWIDARLGDDAIVIVTSDHGEELGEEGRVGHEFGLGQELIHVPLFVRIPGFEGQRIEEIVALRRLYELILSLASGEAPAPDVLLPPDGDPVISERYPSALYVRGMGEPYARSWVSMIENGVKVVGPSEYGLEIFGVDGPGFRESAIVDEAVARELRQKLEEYWATSGDHREAGSAELVLSEQDRRRLRALGYIR